MKAVFKRAVPYADDAMSLPVPDVEAAIPYYLQTFGFELISRRDQPYPSAILARDDIRIGLAENGGDPTQEGCYFEVDDVEVAFEEIKGKKPAPGDLTPQRTFFAVAPDGLCYMIGQSKG